MKIIKSCIHNSHSFLSFFIRFLFFNFSNFKNFLLFTEGIRNIRREWCFCWWPSFFHIRSENPTQILVAYWSATYTAVLTEKKVLKYCKNSYFLMLFQFVCFFFFTSRSFWICVGISPSTHPTNWRWYSSIDAANPTNLNAPHCTSWINQASGAL